MVLPFTTHQGPDGRRFTPVEPSKPCCNGTSTEFSKVRRGANGNRVPPNYPSVEQTEIGRETGKREVLSEQVSSMQSRDGFGTHTRGKKMIETTSSSFSVKVMARLPWRGTMSPTMKAPVKGSVMAQPGRSIRRTKDRMDADDIGKEGGSEHQEDDERHETFRRPICD